MSPGVIIAPSKLIIWVFGEIKWSNSLYLPSAIIFPLFIATASVMGIKSFMVYIFPL